MLTGTPTQPIPKPGWRCARTARRVPSLTAEQGKLLKATIASLQEELLHPDRPWSQQKPGDLRLFKKKVVNACPFLTAYEDAWPAEGLMREYLQRRLQRNAQSRKPARGNHRRAREKGSTVPSCCHARPKGKIDPAEIVEVDSDTEEHIAGSSKRAPTQNSCGDTSPVTRFLASLQPSLVEFTARFVDGGIYSKERLDGLAAMDGHAQDVFLKMDLGLKAFEVAVIRAGLHNTYPKTRK